jgi:hypothetical protein
MIFSLRVTRPQVSSVPNDTILRVRWRLRSLAPTRDVPDGRLSFDGALVARPAEYARPDVREGRKVARWAPCSVLSIS